MPAHMRSRSLSLPSLAGGGGHKEEEEEEEEEERDGRADDGDVGEWTRRRDVSAL